MVSTSVVTEAPTRAASGSTAPPLTSRIELALGLAFWLVAGTAAALTGAFGTWAAYAAPLALLVASWPLLRRQPWAGVLLDWLPFPVVILTYVMLHAVVPAAWTGTIDATLAAWDRSLLGDHAGVLLQPAVHPAVTLAMALAYASYYVMPLSLGVWWYVRGRRQAFRELMVGEVGALFLGYLGYLFLPAIGPHAFLAPETFAVPLQGDFLTPAIRSLNEAHGGAFPRDAFPSLHTANAVTILLVAWRHDRRALLVYLLPALGLISATVYLRYHWVVDVVAGAALATLWQAFVPRLVRREQIGDGGQQLTFVAEGDRRAMSGE